MRGPMPEFDVNEKDGIYYGGGYWNELDAVRRMFNQRISGGRSGRGFMTSPWVARNRSGAP